LRAARANFRPVLRVVRVVLRAVVFLVAIVFLPFCFDVAKLPFQGAFIDNASLFADFVVAHGESITFSGRHAVVPSKYLEVVITKYS